MSIIHDALKKTQGQIVVNSRAEVRKSASYSGSNSIKSRYMLRNITLAVIICGIIFLGLRIRPFFVSSHPDPLLPKYPGKKAADAPAVAKSTVSDAAQTPLKPADAATSFPASSPPVVYPSALPEPVSGHNGSFTLNGIMYSSSRKAVIINNTVLHEGEFIQGARVVEIEEKLVRLDLNGEGIVLRN